ncbi:putative RNase H [Trypanosoma cruzi]|uniref:Putative RNase H n=1 Tax=Trypanosoma cruzi TaxID=5693 RepID=A0A2V2X260_TRYCR|nr:putative RNase H [Trypanosoma cruzi]
MRRRPRQYTEHGIAPIRHTDLLTCINTQLTKKWRSTMHQDTHHYLLGGARPSDPGGKHLITQEALDQQERIHTAREGCGESELWGRLYWTVRDCTNQRRFRNISPEQSAFMRSNDDPTAPGTDAVPPTTREADAPPVERQPSTRRRKKKCPHCDATLVGHTNHIGHCRCFHPERPPPLPDLHRDCCDTVLPTQKKAPHSTEIAAQRTQTLIDTAAAVPGGNHCYRRISQPPQAQQLARRKHCAICFRNVQTRWLCANGWASRRTLAPKASPNGSCLIAGNSCRCSTTSSAP